MKINFNLGYHLDKKLGKDIHIDAWCIFDIYLYGINLEEFEVIRG